MFTNRKIKNIISIELDIKTKTAEEDDDGKIKLNSWNFKISSAELEIRLADDSNHPQRRHFPKGNNNCIVNNKIEINNNKNDVFFS